MPDEPITRLLGFPDFRIVTIDRKEGAVVLTLEKEKRSFHEALVEKKFFPDMTTEFRRYGIFCGGSLRP
ncbi:MAG: hypothetical protein ACP5OP_08490 [Leptospirillia bacterium]